MVIFWETCLENSAFIAPCLSSNKKNEIAFMAEPLDSDLVKDFMSIPSNIENMTNEEWNEYFSWFGWDELTISSIWAINQENACVLIDYTLPNETDPKLLYTLKELIT